VNAVDNHLQHVSGSACQYIRRTAGRECWSYR